MAITKEQVAKLIADTGSNVQVSPEAYDTPLVDLGIDSLDIATTFLAIQESYGIKVPDPKIDELNTVSLIQAYLEAQSSEAG